MAKSPQLMIDWESHRVFCESCDAWVAKNAMWIDGTHDMPQNTAYVDRPSMGIERIRSTHRVWER